MRFHWAAYVRQDIEVYADVLPGGFQQDVRRLAQVVEAQDLYCFRCQEIEEIIDLLEDIENLDQFFTLVQKAAKIANFEHVTVFVVKAGRGIPFKTRLMTSYPKSWTDLYQEQNYQFIDPIFRESHVRNEAFTFDECRGSGPLVNQFWRDAESHLIGREGVCIPFNYPDGSKIAVSFSTSTSSLDTRASSNRSISDIVYISQYLLECFIDLSRRPNVSKNILSNSQLRFLYSLVSGSSLGAETHAEQGKFDMETFEREICMNLGVDNIFQAVSIASMSGWFDDLPFHISEINGVTPSGGPV